MKAALWIARILGLLVAIMVGLQVVLLCGGLIFCALAEGKESVNQLLRAFDGAPDGMGWSPVHVTFKFVGLLLIGLVSALVAIHSRRKLLGLSKA